MNVGTVVSLILALAPGVEPSVIEEKVQDWLDEHPEATTTVADGSITEQKLATSIAQKLGLITQLSDEIVALKANTSPFSVDVPQSIKGIIAFEFLDNDSGYKTEEIEEYKITQLYYKQSGFYLHLNMQKKVNGTWFGFDSVTIVTANAPTETALMILEGQYHRFRVAYIPSLMASSGLNGVSYTIKPAARFPFVTYLQNQINTLKRQQQYGDYELMDEIKHVVHVKPDGTGDYTTISAAYSAITDSAYDNQYEIILYPGTYAEYNLICPPYSHTHGIYPGTVTVTSEGQTGTLPVFDQKQYPSKLSNMKIVSGTGYCIHNDFNFINTGAVINENLYCKKVYGSSVQNFGWISLTNPAIIGAGAQFDGTKIVYKNCTFEDGQVACHSPSSASEDGNFHFVFINCKVVNAWIQLQMAGNTGATTRGHWVCEIQGLNAPSGCPALTTKIGTRIDNKTNFGWQIIGGNNKNFAVRLDNSSDTSTTEIPWESVNTNEKIYCQAVTSITAGQWITDGMNIATANEKAHNILGIALANASVGETFPVWVGNAFPYTATNDEYGIDANGNLSASATEKVGKVLNNIFYRY